MQVRNFVNGRLVAGAEGLTAEIVDPCTGTAYGTAPVSSSVDVDAAMSAAATQTSALWRSQKIAMAKRIALNVTT